MPNKMIKLSSIKLNDGTGGLPKNPRFIRDNRFAALVESIRDNPEYMPARPIIVNEQGVILGGNMRFRGCRELGMKEIPASWVQRVTGWPIEKQRRFIILDNRGFGEDDMDALANEWDIEELIAAGIDTDILSFTQNDEPVPEEKEEDLSPVKTAHILVSMSVDQAVAIMPKIEALAGSVGAEVHRAGN